MQGNVFAITFGKVDSYVYTGKDTSIVLLQIEHENFLNGVISFAL